MMGVKHTKDNAVKRCMSQWPEPVFEEGLILKPDELPV
jgi:hypothetical protein